MNTTLHLPFNINLPMPMENFEYLDNPLVQYRKVGEPTYIHNKDSGEIFFNDKSTLIGLHARFIILTPLFHPAFLICNIAYRIAKLITLSHFWTNLSADSNYDFTARVIEARNDFLRVIISPIASPIALIALECAAIFGVFFPYEGRCLYAAIEVAMYGELAVTFLQMGDPVNECFDLQLAAQQRIDELN